jgi:hypothetical protein
MTRSEASRINGAKSRGPITPEGKAKSSQNAITHGLTASDICICVENPEEFNAFQQAYFDEFQPQTQVERDLVTEMVSAKWRQTRVWAYETALTDFRMEFMKAGLDKQWILPPRTRAAIAVMEEAAPTGSHALQNFGRYEAMLGRMYHRALRTLLQLRAARVPTPAETPVVQNEPETTLLTPVQPMPPAPLVTRHQPLATPPPAPLVTRHQPLATPPPAPLVTRHSPLATPSSTPSPTAKDEAA